MSWWLPKPPVLAAIDDPFWVRWFDSLWRSFNGSNKVNPTAFTSASSPLVPGEEYLHIVNDGTTPFNVTLPLAADYPWKAYCFKNTGDKIVTLIPSGSDTIDFNSTYLLTGYQDAVTVRSNGKQGWIVENTASAPSRVFAWIDHNMASVDAAHTQIELNREVFDTLNEFDTTNYKFVARSGGYYRVSAKCAHVCGAVSTTGKVTFELYKNGAVVWQAMEDRVTARPAAGGWTENLSIDTNVFLNPTDYLELYIYSQQGVNGTVTGGNAGYKTWMAIEKLYI